MPHATMPAPGFQALILCGPGVSLNTFTSNPKDFPKALVPIANRPMVWYPLEWCYRMGVTNITLITPPESAPALEAALSQNPHLTSLPAPKPDVLAPESLTQTTGTGEIFRLPEVQAVVRSDFIVLPCDLVCELDGSSLLEAWLVTQAGLGGSTGGVDEDGRVIRMSPGGENLGRRGGLGVWYPTRRGEDDDIKKQETDFVATTPLSANPVVPPPTGSLRSDLANLVYAVPTDTLRDITDERKSFPVRHALLRRHGRVRMLTSHRDAHVYFFPFWALELMRRNESFDSLGEDVLGWWAKAGWQEGLGEKLGMDEILGQQKKNASDSGEESMALGVSSSGLLDDAVDVAELSSTWLGPTPTNTSQPGHNASNSSNPPFASRVKNASSPTTTSTPAKPPLTVPPILAYVQPTHPRAPLIRRVDTVPLLINTSLRLAKLPSLDDVGGQRAAASPLAHAAKIAHPAGVPLRCRVDAADCLLAENVTVGERVNIKESVLGPGCTVGAGARLLRCLLMEGAVVGEGAQLTGCVLGRRCRVEGAESVAAAARAEGAGEAKGKKKAAAADEERTVLKDCEVQEGNVVPWGTEAKNEKFMVFEGLSDDEADVRMAGEGGEPEAIEAPEDTGVSLR